jgi:riboflavin kinase/FMN adenylyltransferase
MEVVRLDDLSPRGWPASAVTVGNFDGVHRGHQALVAVAVEDARAASGTAVVLTFDPHPSRVLSPDRAPSALTTLKQKAEILERLGVDKLAVLPFTRELAEESPEEFARKVLAGAASARLVVVGANFRFGHGRSGDVDTLVRLGAKLGFRVHAVPPLLHEGAPISSTRIREALFRGAVEAVPPLLGRRYFVDGRVVRGAGRGKPLGIATANLEVVNETLPARGVYASFCRIAGPGGRLRPSVVNLGRRPTFGGGETTLEAHLLDFDQDLYGQSLRVEFVRRLRDERHFPDVPALLEQIRRDVAEARAALADPGAAEPTDRV